MSKLATTTELRKMPSTDLRREIREQELTVAKLHMGVEVGKEKDTARYQRERRQLSRMKTILCEMEGEELLKQTPKSTVSAHVS